MKIQYPLFLRSIQNAQFFRQNATHAESLLWNALRNRRLDGVKFRRQHPFQQFVFDFFCPQHLLIIELDGPIHQQPPQKERDAFREQQLRRSGFVILRFSNKEVEEGLPRVLSKIRSTLHEIEMMKPAD